MAVVLFNLQQYEQADKVLQSTLSAQLRYVKGQKDHPFLEQTYMHLGILHRTIKQFTSAFFMFQQLLNTQKRIYGEDSDILIFAYKNCGLCLLANADPKRAQEHYLKALELCESEVEAKKKSLLEEGEEAREGKTEDEYLNAKLKDEFTQTGQVYFSLYLSSVGQSNIEEALKWNQENMNMNKRVYGPDSIHVSNNYFIKSTMNQKALRMPEALEAINEALATYERSTEKEVPLEVRYR